MNRLGLSRPGRTAGSMRKADKQFRKVVVP
jgi:hypothetical protein